MAAKSTNLAPAWGSDAQFTATAALEAAQTAYRNPMLALLARRDAPLITALLGLVFSAERLAVPVADVHAEISTALADLRNAGIDMPEKTARELCRTWVEAGWLATQTLDPVRPAEPSLLPDEEQPGLAMAAPVTEMPDGETTEVYRLTAHAVGALEVTNRAGGNRASVSRSRILTLLAAVDQLAAEVDPSMESRIERLQAEIDERKAQIKQLKSGGIVPETPVDQLLESAETVLLQVRELPADFARVAESVKAIQRDTVTALRAEDRPTGEVLRDYLERAEHLMEGTAEGRAFGGALELLEDHEMLEQLNHNLHAVLAHPFAEMLTPTQRRDLAGIGRLIELGLDNVLAARRRATHVVTQAVSHLDPMRDRQVDDLLRSVIAGLGAWIPESRRGQEVPAARRLPRADLGRPRGDLADLGSHNRPQPLAAQPETHEPVSFTEAKAWGGPDYGSLESALQSTLANAFAALPDGAEKRVEVTDIFTSLPDGARRPVDLVGLLELAAVFGLHDDAAVAEVTATRPDGSVTRLAFQSANLAPAQPENQQPRLDTSAPQLNSTLIGVTDE